MHRFSCLKSEFSCIARITTSNDNILVGNSQLSLTMYSPVFAIFMIPADYFMNYLKCPVGNIKSKINVVE